MAMQLFLQPNLDQRLVGYVAGVCGGFDGVQQVCWGSRSEIVLVVGFKFGKVTFRAFDQSRYSVESCVSQNARS